MQKLSFHFLTDFSFRDCNILHQIIKVHDHRDINYTKDHVEICIVFKRDYPTKMEPCDKALHHKTNRQVTGVKKITGSMIPDNIRIVSLNIGGDSTGHWITEICSQFIC